MSIETLFAKVTGRDKVCVCGHPEADHPPVAMSVPLTPNLNPIYALPSQKHNNIVCTHPTATYDQLACHCGCASWLPDDGQSDWR